jgi:hypothetical protein
MRERPIDLTAREVEAVMLGRKTLLLFPCKPQPDHGPADGAWECWTRGPCALCGGEDGRAHAPRGVAGDGLWVRERWRPDLLGDTPVISYATNLLRRPSGDVLWVPRDAAGHADWAYEQATVRATPGWRSSCGMPRWASRATLRIKSAAVRRLRETTNEQAMAWGVPQMHGEAVRAGMVKPRGSLGGPGPCSVDEWDNATSLENFARVWDARRHEALRWARDPYVWAIEFVTEVAPWARAEVLR